MHFSRFSVVESLVSIHLAPLSGPLSRYRIYYSDTLHLRVPIDQDGTNVLRLGMLLIILVAFHSNLRRFPGEEGASHVPLRSIFGALRHFEHEESEDECQSILGFLEAERSVNCPT